MDIRTFKTPEATVSSHCEGFAFAGGKNASFRLFRLLSANGTLSGCAFLHRLAERPDCRGKSLLVPQASLRLRLKANTIAAEAIDALGQTLLPLFARRLGAGHEVDPHEGRFELRLEQSSVSKIVTDRERLLAPSVLDSIRSLVTILSDEDNDVTPPIAVLGAFGYELIDRFEDLPDRLIDPLQEDDFDLVLALNAIEIDHEKGLGKAVVRSFKSQDCALSKLSDLMREIESYTRLEDEEPAVPKKKCAAAPTTHDIEGAEFESIVEAVLENIRAGEVFQTVISRSFDTKSDAKPVDVFAHLLATESAPYNFFYDLQEGSLFGASPECSVKVNDQIVELTPIAGTAPRGFRDEGEIDADLDARLAAGLLLDPKEQAEHAMLVDLARNDLARIAVPGTREVVQPFELVSFRRVQHIVSRVRAQLDPKLDALDAYRACANMGTLTGAPKLRSMELIRRFEKTARGYYGGAFGILEQNGNFDSCIIIRSLRFKNGTYHARAGAGIVADSQPTRELNETRHKSAGVLEALLQVVGEEA